MVQDSYRESAGAPRVGLFVTCLVDAMRPSIGFAAITLLEAAGCRVEVPLQQTCCGQTRHRRPDFKEDQQRLDPTTEFAQFLCMFQIGIEARRTELALCLVEAIVEDVVNSVEAAIESVAQRLVAQWLTFGAH